MRKKTRSSITLSAEDLKLVVALQAKLKAKKRVRVVRRSLQDAYRRASHAARVSLSHELAKLKPVWVSYFRVTDCDDTVVKCLKLGGSISVPAESVPTVGRFAVLVDPAGAHFGIMQPA
jgi:hypothetical protein